MLNNERDLVTRLLKQNIVTLCKEAVSYDTQLEIDGIICISAGNESQQIVVKVHHFFQKLTQNAKSQQKNTPDNCLLEPRTDDKTWEERRREKRYIIENGQPETNSQNASQHFPDEIKYPHLRNRIKTEKVPEYEVPSRESPSIMNSTLYHNSIEQRNWSNETQNNALQIPKTIRNLEQDEMSLHESEKMLSNDSSSENESMEEDDDSRHVFGSPENGERKENSFTNKFDVGVSQQSSPINALDANKSFESKLSRKQTTPDENSMIECTLGKNSSTEEDLSKVPIREVKDIPCKRCNVVLADGSAFEQHNTDVHSVYTCRVCFNTFTCRNNMKRHMRLHTGFRPYTCKLCSESFTRKDDIKRHLIRHSFDKPFRCNVCKKGYMDRKTVKNHVRKEHNSKTIHICQTCGETFDNSAKFQDHKKNHPELKNYQCSLCKFTGSNLLTYNKHQLIHEVKKDYRCDPCDLVFGDPFRYTTHLRKHRTDPNFMSYRCCFCNLNFSGYELFLRHEHTHDLSQQFTCFVCMKHFQSEAVLKDHKRSHPTYNSQAEMSTGLLLPNIVSTPVEQPIFPTFMSPFPKEVKLEPYEETLAVKINDTTPKLSHDHTDLNKSSDNQLIPLQNGDKSEIKIEDDTKCISEGNDPNDYWCAECQHGFSTEEHLTEHIALAHENVDNNSRWDKPDISEFETETKETIEDLPKTFGLKISDQQCSYDESEGSESMDNSNSPSNNIRYTPVPIYISRHNSKRGNVHQDSNVIGNDTSLLKNKGMGTSNDDSNQTEDSLSLDEGNDNEQHNRSFERWSEKNNYQAQNQFMCIVCLMDFPNFDAFDWHSSNIHRKFICNFCGKSFTSRPNRDRHIRYHTGEKPFKCEVCDQSFVRGDDLRYHRTSKHPDVKPYICKFCGLGFAWTKDLERHAKTHGTGQSY